MRYLEQAPPEYDEFARSFVSPYINAFDFRGGGNEKFGAHVKPDEKPQAQS